MWYEIRVFVTGQLTPEGEAPRTYCDPMENDQVPVIFREVNRLTRAILETVVSELRRLGLPSAMGPSDQSFLVAAVRTHVHTHLGGGMPPDAVHPATMSPATKAMLAGLSDESVTRIFHDSTSLKIQEDTLRETARLGDSPRAKFFRWKDEVFTLMSPEALNALGKDSKTYHCIIAIKKATDDLCERADDKAAFESGVVHLRDAFKHLVKAGLQRDFMLPAVDGGFSNELEGMSGDKLLRELLISFGGQEETRVYPNKEEFLKIKALREEVLRRLDERDRLVAQVKEGKTIDVQFGDSKPN